MTEQPANERPIQQGGLMRCCVQTLQASQDLTAKDDVMECNYCSNSMRVGPEGAWHANFIKKTSKG